jgi:hypothetical protein
MSYRRGGRHGQILAFDRHNGCPPQHMHATLLERHLSHLRFDLVFTVVRNPFSRIVSEYRWRRGFMQDFPFATANDFVRHVSDRIESRANLFDNHVRPQHEFLWRDCMVFRLEDGLHNAFDAVGAHLGIPVALSAERHMGSRSLEESDRLDDASRDLIRTCYRRDFETFGYPLDAP